MKMNEEIKIKTLGQLLDYVETEEKGKKLINYITNLQEENQKLKEIVGINNDDEFIYSYEELQDKILELQKEYNILSKKIWGEVNDRIELKEENDLLKAKIKCMEEKINYKTAYKDESEIYNEFFR